RSPAWRHSPRTGCATRSRNTASSRMCAPAWRSATRAADPNWCHPSAESRGDIAAIDGGDIGGGFERHGMVQKSLSDVLRRHLAPEQIARHIVLLADATRLGAGGDQFRRQEAAPNAVCVDRVGANAVGPV